MTADFDLETARRHHQEGRLAQAEAVYRQILNREPAHHQSMQLLGLLLHQQGKSAEGLELVRRAIALSPSVASYHLNLGGALAQQGRAQEALEETRKAIELDPAEPQAHFNLGILLETLERYEEAIQSYRQAIVLRPNLASAFNNLGNALHKLGRFDEADVAFRQSLQFRPNDAKTVKNLGKALHDLGRLTEAAEEYRHAIALDSTDAEAHNSLGTVLASARRLDEAIELYRKALALQADHTMAMTNLGNALKETGQLDEGIIWFRRALEAGADARTGDCLMVAIHLHPDYDPERIAQEHREWEEKFAKALVPPGDWFPNDPDPRKRLRIGYVSPQFGDQIVGHCVLPLLANHDHEKFEIICYSDTRRADWMTERLRSTADIWRDTASLSDDRLSALIRQDRIDILVDLTMHMERNRLLVFARKPAPVQMTWIGYPSTTGLHTIDYRLSDHFLDPPGELPIADCRLPNESAQSAISNTQSAIYSERTLFLPDSYWCYQPLEGLPPPNELPALKNGFVTFGCLNSFVKVNEQAIRLWAAVLKTVPSSRMFLLAPTGNAREWVIEVMQSQGIDPARIGFLDRQPRRKYMELYHQIDLGLDTIPYNGHTTMLDALWMGVPVVSMTGKTAVSRGGLGILSNLGLSELCAGGPDEFVNKAATLAASIPRLAELRFTLRERMARSRLMDGPRFARGIENCYRTGWRQWSEQHQAASWPITVTPKNAFHVMIVEPPGCKHSACLYELANLLMLSLQDLGYNVTVGKNELVPQATNIVLGYHLIEEPLKGSNWIIYQLEQLDVPGRRKGRLFDALAHAPEIWDYDIGNIQFLAANGIPGAKHVPMGFHPKLRTIPHRTPDIDVLHYGQMSERRQQLLDVLSKHCRVQVLADVYGEERDQWIARSKIVLNIHRYEAPIFEQVRVSYLLNNGCCVVSEDSPYNPYRDMTTSVSYGQLVDRCLELVSDDAQRERIAAEGARKFEAMPMTGILRHALEGIPLLAENCSGS